LNAERTIIKPNFAVVNTFCKAQLYNDVIYIYSYDNYFWFLDLGNEATPCLYNYSKKRRREIAHSLLLDATLSVV